MGLFSRKSIIGTQKRKRSSARPQARKKIKQKQKSKGIIRRKIGKTFLYVTGGIFVILILGGIIGSIFFLSSFRIQEIRIAREDFRVDAEEVSKYTKTLIGQNIFLISEREIQTELYEKIPELDRIEINKELPRSLIFHLSTHPVAFRWGCEWMKKEISEEGEIIEEPQSETYYINFSGRVTVPNPDEKEVFLISEKIASENNALCKKIKRRDQILPSERVQEIFDAKKNLEEILDMPVIQAEYLREAQEIHLMSENESVFWIDFVTPTTDQLSNLSAALTEDSSLSTPMDHVDLRVPGKIFYEER